MYIYIYIYTYMFIRLHGRGRPPAYKVKTGGHGGVSRRETEECQRLGLPLNVYIY